MTDINSYLHITDAEIRDAEPFDGWHDDYTSNPSWSLDDRAKNAWHVRYFADLMRTAGLWVGPPAIVDPTALHPLQDGNHRVRAAEFAKSEWGVVVKIPTVEAVPA